MTPFLMDAAGAFLDARDPAAGWFAQLDMRDLRLADRTEVYRAGLALLHQVPRLKQWEQQAPTGWKPNCSTCISRRDDGCRSFH